MVSLSRARGGDGGVQSRALRSPRTLGAEDWFGTWSLLPPL
jgi:hypothetical protein